jgi:excisionase family DNA binding protein
METFYSPEQIASLLHLKATTIRRYIAEGKIKAIRVNEHTLRIAESSYEEFIENGSDKV